MKKQPLIFVDTNIFLDFYRIDSKPGLELLDKLYSLRQNLITTMQVEMEFKKNRQGVLLDTLTRLKAPDTFQFPALLRDRQESLTLQTLNKQIQQRLTKLHAKLERMLKDPAKYDLVYKGVHRVLNSSETHRLDSSHKSYKRIRAQAFRRFMLGCPPRKSKDTSAGDSLNWEWIIECCLNAEPCNVIIVSRDGDYGAFRGGKAYLNDWLVEEFKDVVSRKRKVILVPSVTDALKEAAVKVTDAQQKAEKEIITIPQSLSLFTSEQRASLSDLARNYGPPIAEDARSFQEALDEITRLSEEAFASIKTKGGKKVKEEA